LSRREEWHETLYQFQLRALFETAAHFKKLMLIVRLHPFIRSVLLLLPLAGAYTFVGTASAAQKVVFSFAGVNERYGCLFVAKDQRFFEEEGLDAQIVQMRNGPIAISAMAGGETHFYTASATGATLGAMIGGLDLVFVGGLINKLDGDFVASPKIKSPAGLKGKVVGIQSIGGGIWMYTLLALDHWGLDADRDKIQLRVIGDQAVLVQALTTGVIDGAFLGHTFGRMLGRQGYRILTDSAKTDIDYQSTGILARKSLIDKSPEFVEKSLRSLSRGIAFIQEPENRPAVLRSLAKWLRLQRPEDAEAGYETIRNGYDRRLAASKEGLRNALRILIKVDAKFARLRVEDLVDDRITRKLERDRGN
jgi:NitT/TauT family transport system substrate-binding protein